jgi:uncharacterized protein YfkK (UPF0435 family)
MSEILNNLFFELSDIKFSKLKVINSQKYEKAAELRDSERNIERKIYSIIYGNDIYDSKKLSDGLNDYCLKNFGFTYESLNQENIRQKIREIKLKQLGIN